MNQLPQFHEHEEDHLIPSGYGIDESHDGGFYPYRIVLDYQTDKRAAGYPVYLKRNGLDMRCATYEEAREYIAEIVN